VLYLILTIFGVSYV